ncbi:hypothetical protein LCGC14_0993160 [marine sediment metagenome]|uniref:Double-GTPase 1 domain-containing protein n=1 Tax=marine sediment metagenome TaxID=412755 RepID=A0A0F9N9S7_9ZZZZ
MTSPSDPIVLVGLPGAGKTTFLAALWYALNHSTDGGISLNALPEDQAYLNEISRTWRQGEPQPHTATAVFQEIRLCVRYDGADVPGELVLPDLSGECFQQDQWADRHWNQKYDSIARAASGVVLLVHPDAWKGSPRIADVARAEQLIEGSVAESQGEHVASGGAGRAGADESDQVEANVVDFDPLRVPAQVILVDLLQFLIGDPCFHTALRVSVVISAWDLLESRGRTPSVCLEKEMPLLHQFLTSNADRISCQVFGVSAQGGPYEDPRVRQNLLQMDNPIERIQVRDADGNTSDITAPILWQVRDRVVEERECRGIS